MEQGTKNEIEDVVDCIAEDPNDLEEVMDGARSARQGLEEVRRHFNKHGVTVNDTLLEALDVLDHIINHAVAHH